MIQKYRSSLLVTLLCGVSAVSLHAQRPDGPPPGGGPGAHHGPPPNLLFEALDTNHDGTISADEMNNAAASLKTLLKNGATELKREDLRPPRPEGRPEGRPEEARAQGKPPGPSDEADAGRPGRHMRGGDDADAGRPGRRARWGEDNEAGRPGRPAREGEERGEENRPHHGPPPSPLFDALDANHDGVISADEMDKAPAAIKSLLKNGATELKREDIRPPRPQQRQED